MPDSWREERRLLQAGFSILVCGRPLGLLVRAAVSSAWLETQAEIDEGLRCSSQLLVALSHHLLPPVQGLWCEVCHIGAGRGHFTAGATSLRVWP